MILKMKYFVPPLIVLAALTLWVAIAYANPLYVGKPARTAVATTTLTYLTPGTATSTPVYDSYEVNGTNETNSGNNTVPDMVAVLLQGNASSTATTLNVQCEFGDDSGSTSSAIDWYQNEIYPATTTGAMAIGTPLSFAYTYASSTAQTGGAIVPGNMNAFHKLVECPVPTRYVRAVITDTGANAALWATILPMKQRN